VIAALADSAVDDVLFDAECEQVGQILVVSTAATLTYGVGRFPGWTEEIQGDVITLMDCVTADLTRGSAFGWRCYL
jgi:hypothetical protein